MTKNIGVFVFFAAVILNCNKTPVVEAPINKEEQQHESLETIREFYDAIKSENYEAAIMLLSNGIDPNMFFENNETPLTLAIQNKPFRFSHTSFTQRQEMELKRFIEELIKKGGDVNLEADGDAPLNLSLSRDLDEISILLIDQGINWNYLDKRNRSYFENAIIDKRIIVLRHMLQYDEMIRTIITKRGLSLLFVDHWCDGTEEIIDTLMDHGLKLGNDYLLLSTALIESEPDAAKWLFDHGVSLHEVDDSILELAFEGRGRILRSYNVNDERGENFLLRSDRVVNLVLEQLEKDDYRERNREELTQMFLIYYGSPYVKDIPQSEWDPALLKWSPMLSRRVN